MLAMVASPCFSSVKAWDYQGPRSNMELMLDLLLQMMKSTYARKLCWQMFYHSLCLPEHDSLFWFQKMICPCIYMTILD
jgi:hypothetical protein